jgi:deoxyribonuclease IV
MLGSHLSVAGGMVNALHKARQFKMDCVQVFTKNQRQWNTRPLDAVEQSLWLTELKSMRWDSFSNPSAPGRVVSHNSYLINLAQPDPILWKKSVAAQRIELERCEALHIPFCVSHPGAHLGSIRPAGSANSLDAKPSGDELAGLKRIAMALNQLHRELPGYRVMTCLETTVGSGTNLGYNFHQLSFIRQSVKEADRIGFCADTCHLTAAGYDLSTTERAEAVFQHWDEICGLENLKVFHLNDSMGARGSRRDRHAHIGQGCCGKCCFQVILNHPAFEFVPKILETPKGLNDKGVEWDLVNLRRLKRMAVQPVFSR